MFLLLIFILMAGHYFTPVCNDYPVIGKKFFNHRIGEKLSFPDSLLP